MPEMSNDLLTLWLRAGNGLQASEARELVERLAAMEAEQADSDAAISSAEGAHKAAEEAFAAECQETRRLRRHLRVLARHIEDMRGTLSCDMSAALRAADGLVTAD